MALEIVVHRSRFALKCDRTPEQNTGGDYELVGFSDDVVGSGGDMTPALGQTVADPVASNTAQDQQAMPYSVVHSDTNGVTHFRNEYLAWRVGQGLTVTPYVNAEKIGFLRIAQGRRFDWHPAPSKRFVMVLSGLLEVEVGDGERRTFGPGNVLLVTDAEGRGHLTNVLGNEDVFLVWVPVP
jgi:quercetin dioxygenase-like cupin family protein